MSTATDTAGKVTRIDGQRAAKKGVTRARSLLEHCRKQLREHMSAAMPTIMDQVDDALFQLAEKADTNQLQSTYFEAMRSVRLARAEVESRFASELETAIDQRMNPGAGSGFTLPELDPKTFSLVEQDDLEESLAVKNIAGKIRNVCHEDLFALDRRVALLMSAPNLEGDDNPLGPEVLSNAARGAVAAMDASLEIRLLVLKLFDRHLTRAAEHYYCSTNDWLAREGVLPNVRASVGSGAGTRARPQPGPRTGATAGGAPPAHAGEGAAGGGGSASGWEGYHAVAGADAGAGPGASNGGVAAGGAAGDGAVPPGWGSLDGARREQILGVLEQVMRIGGGGAEGFEGGDGRERFIGSLTHLQRDPGALLGDAGAGGGAAAAGGAPGVVANVIRELRSSPAAGDVSQVDGLLIDVVAMMFDYILEDRNIGDATRALVGRLQIPVLKVAILDKTFFARRSHPARTFINTLAEYGARAGDAEHGPVFARMRELVDRIIAEFETELDVFSGALEELQAIVAREDDEAKGNAWSTAQVAEEREKLARARKRAEQEVDARVDARALPSVVETFLRTHWRQLLAERLFRDGEDSDPWRAGIVTMDRLIWSVEPKREQAHRDRLLSMLPFLLEQLKLGMHELGLGADARGPFLRALSELHIASLKGDDAPAPQRDETAADAGPAATAGAPAGSAPDRPAPAAPETGADPFAEAPAAQPIGAETARLLTEAVEHSNAMVWQTAEERPQCQGMGATLVAVKLEADRLVCAHAGDSRLYRLRGGALEQITRDHTYRQEALDKGLVDEEHAAEIASNLITRAIGGDATINVEVNVHDTQPGDLFLSCSDGLSDMVDDARIESLMRTDPGAVDLDALARALIDAANAAGGRDNISVGLMRIDAALPGQPGAHDYAGLVSIRAATDPGRRRAHNEDAIEGDASIGALVLADGMGGHNAGEVASAMAVKLVMEALRPGNVPGGAHDAGDGTFDFEAINAVFWDDTPVDQGNEALYDAVADEVESIVLDAGDDLDACFDLDAEPAAMAGDAARDPLLERVIKLTPGTWVEFGEEAGKGVRARLSWVAPERARFLFTDRFGQKVSDATPHGLALELRLGRLRVLETIPLFDRVVSRVSHSLRATDGEVTENVA